MILDYYAQSVEFSVGGGHDNDIREILQQLRRKQVCKVIWQGAASPTHTSTHTVENRISLGRQLMSSKNDRMDLATALHCRNIDFVLNNLASTLSQKFLLLLSSENLASFNSAGFKTMQICKEYNKLDVRRSTIIFMR